MNSFIKACCCEVPSLYYNLNLFVMYRLFARLCKVSDIYDILNSDSSVFNNTSWRCSLLSSFPICGYIEFKEFLDFFDFISMLNFRYPDTILTIYYKSSKL